MNGTPSVRGPLRYSVGQRIAGLVCEADIAFDRLRREVARLGHASLWGWFGERCRTLEAKLIELGGFDERLAEQIETCGFFGRSEDFDRFDETETLMFELESLCAAFFVALQPRLNAIRVAVKAVYHAAANEDHLPIAVPASLQVSESFEAAWEVANFVKHHDEWGEKLQPRQRRAFVVLCRLDVAREENGERQLDRFPLVLGTCALAGERSLDPAINAIVTRCQEGGTELMAAVQTHFAPIAAELERVRKANAPRLRIRSSQADD